MYCKEKWRTAGGKDPLFGHVDGFQIDPNKLIVKLEFVEVSARPEQHCHSEPVRTLVWESPSNYGQPIVIQTVLLYRFPEFIHEKWYV